MARGPWLVARGSWLVACVARSWYLVAPKGAKRTTKRLELALGPHTKAFQMAFISNQNFDMGELDKYARILKENAMQMKSKREIQDKVGHPRGKLLLITRGAWLAACGVGL